MDQQACTLNKHSNEACIAGIAHNHGSSQLIIIITLTMDQTPLHSTKYENKICLEIA